MLPGVRGYVLAGGESSRMQGAGLPVDKAMLAFRGKTLLERACHTLQQVCTSCGVLCGNSARCARLGVEHVGLCDRLTGMGPVGALEAALADATAAGWLWALLLPVDQPLMSVDALLVFGNAALGSGSAAVCMQANGLLQPLPTLVRADAVRLVQERLQQGERKVVPTLQAIASTLTPAVGFQPIPVDTLLNHQTSKLFWNVNTPADLKRLKECETLGDGRHQSTHAGKRPAGQSRTRHSTQR